jgi:hypothetical protein
LLISKINDETAKKEFNDELNNWTRRDNFWKESYRDKTIEFIKSIKIDISKQILKEKKSKTVNKPDVKDEEKPNVLDIDWTIVTIKDGKTFEIDWKEYWISLIVKTFGMEMDIFEKIEKIDNGILITTKVWKSEELKKDKFSSFLKKLEKWNISENIPNKEWVNVLLKIYSIN